MSITPLHPLGPRIVIRHNRRLSPLLRFKCIHNCTNCHCALGKVQLIFRRGNSLSGAAKGEGVRLIPEVH